jgi:outer membrane receptor for ferrienterochelin and colicins
MHRLACRWLEMAFCALILLFAFSVAAAQNGAIQGRVTDSQGLPVAAASLSLRNTLTGTATQTKTDSTGKYSLAELDSASYTLTAQSKGFADQVQYVSISSPQESVQQDFQLRVAGVKQDVTVLSSSRVEELQTESTAPISVITRDQILETGKQSVGSLLSEVPGVITRDYDLSFTPGIAGEQIQGIDSRQVLVLRDGLPVAGARGISSGVLDLNTLGVEQVEQVEVVKGATSALYGSDAIGGVINVITREPTAPLTGDIDISGGSVGTFDPRASLGAKLGNFWLQGDFEHHQGDSYTLLQGTPDLPSYDRNIGSFRAHYKLNEKVDFGFSANGYHYHDGRIVDSDTGLVSDVDSSSETGYALTGNFQLNQTTNLQILGYLDQYNGNSLDTSVPPDYSNVAERYHRGDATLSHLFGTHQYVQVGYEWVQDLYRGIGRIIGGDAGQQVTTNDIWAQDRIQVVPRLMITVGARYQHHSLYGNHAVPKVGVNYRLKTNFVLRGSYAQGFRAPDLGQLYYDFVHAADFYQLIGNPTLRPETSQTFNMGFDYRRPRWYVSFDLYRNNVHNLIDFQNLGFPDEAQLQAIEQQYNIPSNNGLIPGLLTEIYLNLDHIYTQGFEMGGEVAATTKLAFRGAYTYLDAWDISDQTELPNRSRHQGFVEARYHDSRHGFSANMRGSLIGGWLTGEPLAPGSNPKEPAYAIWYLYGSKSISHGISAYATVDNLFNSLDPLRYAPVPEVYRDAYGRTFRIGIRYSFIHE